MNVGRDSILGFKDICRHIHNVARNPQYLGSQKQVMNCHNYDVWLPRIVIIGRRGSGCKTQGTLLAKRLNLIYS